MGILAGQTLKNTDFEKISSGVVDKIPVTNEEGKIDPSFLKFAKKFDTFQQLDGSTTPLPVALLSAGAVAKSDANQSGIDNFIGFVKGDYSASSALPDYLGGTAGNFPNGATTYSLTAPAGNDRVITVFMWHYNGYTPPTSMVWNGTSFSLLKTQAHNGNTLNVWQAVIGSSVSSQTFNVVMTGGNRSGNNASAQSSMVHADVDQVAPYSEVQSNGGSGGSYTTPAIAHNQGYGLFLAGAAYTGTTITNSGYVDRQTSGGIRGGEIIGGAGLQVSATRFSSLGVAGISLNSAKDPVEVEVFYTDIVAGFTGLTIGAKYYVQNVDGTIGTAVGATSILVGIAVSATEILIVR